MLIAILAGGQSKRFGRDKLMCDVLGKPLIDMVYENLAPLDIPIYIVTSVSKADVYRARGWNVLVDSYLIGPIGGIITALKEDDVFVVAGDMPFVDAKFVSSLITKSGESGLSVVPTHSGELLEPLHAVYKKNMLEPMLHYVESGDRGIQYFLKTHRDMWLPYHVSSYHMRSFYNINTPEDLDAICPKLSSQ